MNTISNESNTRPCWFVGAHYTESGDQTDRFLEEGIWEHGFDDDHQDVATTKTMQAGDRIAIKSAYVRKHDLPFDSRNRFVSVMAIKAIGRIIENSGDGHVVKVAWHRVRPVREWYFYTFRGTVWEVLPGESWHNNALIGFAFENKPQDIEGFLKIPFWRERYKDQRFAWTSFYEAFADQLLTFIDKRTELIDRVHAIATKENSMYLVQDQFSDGTSGPLKDICPFTVMGMFNRQIKNPNRLLVASELADLLGVSEPVPNELEGIPVVDNRSSWFFNYDRNRNPEDIDVLWEVFSRAITFYESEDSNTRSAFVSAYDSATELPHVGWKLSFGLYWIRPWSFPSLDTSAREYIQRKLDTVIGLNGPKNRCNANDYLNVRDSLDAKFREEECPVKSFPHLAYEVWINKNPSLPPPPPPQPPTPPTYTLDDIVTDGCFIDRDKLDLILDRLRFKKNLILQGPPGTGKTWLARKLAYALIGMRDDGKIRSVQFHPNLSYEDFVRGWRPADDGKLKLVDGPFIALADEAEKDPDNQYVMVVEEINRGNPAQIFGEMLTLLEADKRTREEALELIYKRSPVERFFIPDNLHVIGTMNVADRSIALVDLALRRRFAFIDLEPTFGKPWRDWVHSNCGIGIETLREIEKRIVELNNTITEDNSLGSHYRVGHAFFTPTPKQRPEDATKWYREVVNTEIGPLLDEYWFENLEASTKAKQDLLEGFQ